MCTCVCKRKASHKNKLDIYVFVYKYTYLYILFTLNIGSVVSFQGLNKQDSGFIFRYRFFLIKPFDLKFDFHLFWQTATVIG